MVQDSSEKLLATLGLRIRVTDPTDARRVRGAKKRICDGMSWSQRMRTWRKGAYKKKDPVTHEFLYRHTNWPITERWQNDPDFQFSCNQMAQAYFDCDFTYEMAVEADELAQKEEAESHERAHTHALPSDVRVGRFVDRPEVRSTQAGGANTRPRAGTYEERRALQDWKRGRRAKVRAKANLEVRPTTCRTWCSAKRDETPSTMLSRRYAVWLKSSFCRLCFFLNYLVDIIQL